jgi:hypothetical protein
LCRRESEQRADRGAIDPHARAPLDAELFSTPGEQPVQGVDPGDDRAAFDPAIAGWGIPVRVASARWVSPARRRASRRVLAASTTDDNKEGIDRSRERAKKRDLSWGLFQIVELGSDIWNRTAQARAGG